MSFLGKVYFRLSLFNLALQTPAFKGAWQRQGKNILSASSTTFQFQSTASEYLAQNSFTCTCTSPKYERLFLSSSSINSESDLIKEETTLNANAGSRDITLFSSFIHVAQDVCISTGTIKKQTGFGNMAEKLDDSGFGDVDMAHTDLSLMKIDSEQDHHPMEVNTGLVPNLESDTVVIVEDTHSANTQFSAAAEETEKKKTVLPEALLKEVTSMVEQGVVTTETEARETKTADDPPAKSPRKKRARKSKQGKDSLSSASPDLTTDQHAEGDDQPVVEDSSKLAKGGKKKKKKKGKDLSKESKSGNEVDDEPEKKKSVPTHFVSIQINNPEIHKAMNDVQQAILKAEKRLEKAMVATATAHLTLMVMRLETDEDITRARDALSKCVAEHWSHYSQGYDQLDIQVAGLGHFDHTVLFAKVTPGPPVEELKKIAKSVESCLAEADVFKADPKEFKPHITLMKFSGKRGQVMRKQGIKKIDVKLYEEFTDRVFGSDTVTSLQLCSMNLPKHPETGYYHIEYETGLNKDYRSGQSEMGIPAIKTEKTTSRSAARNDGKSGDNSVLHGTDDDQNGANTAGLSEDTTSQSAATSGELSEDTTSKSAATAGELSEDTTSKSAATSGELSEDTTSKSAATSGELSEDTTSKSAATSGELSEDTTGKSAATSGELSEDTTSKSAATSGELSEDTTSQSAATAGELSGDTTSKSAATAGELSGDTNSQSTANTVGSSEDKSDQNAVNTALLHDNDSDKGALISNDIVDNANNADHSGTEQDNTQ